MQLYLGLATGKSHSVGLLVLKALLTSSALALWINATFLFNLTLVAYILTKLFM